jgi:hypothetical protein
MESSHSQNRGKQRRKDPSLLIAENILLCSALASLYHEFLYHSSITSFSRTYRYNLRVQNTARIQRVRNTARKKREYERQLECSGFLPYFRRNNTASDWHQDQHARVECFQLAGSEHLGYLLCLHQASCAVDAHDQVACHLESQTNHVKACKRRLYRTDAK